MASKELKIQDQIFNPGEKGVIKISVGKLTSGTDIELEAHIFRSKKIGNTTLLLAGVHGDEINGIEILRRTLKEKYLHKLSSGTVIVIPIVNLYGFINFNRYVPDGKDVNRSFPGTLNGSLASRIARTLTKYIFPHIDYIFDFHTGGDLRYNYPQIRYSKNDLTAAKLADIFFAPYTIRSGIIPKSLRKTAKSMSITTLIYEGGESIRFNHDAISIGTQGLLRCLVHLGHIDKKYSEDALYKNSIIENTSWIRSSHSGIFIFNKRSGETIAKGEKLASINDPYARKTNYIIAKKSGHIIGHNNASVVNHGDALFHIGFTS